MNGLDHDATVELLGAYALDAVDPDEATAVADHVQNCDSCAGELAAFREVTGLIANSGGDAPSHLWSSIAEQIERPAPAFEGRLGGQMAGSPRRVATRPRSWWRARPLVTVAVAAGIVLVAVLGVEVGRLDNRVNQLQSEGAQQGLTRAADHALADPTAQHVVLTADTGSTAAVARIAILPSGAGFLVNRALAPLAADRTYQLWGQVGGALISLGVLGAHPRALAFHVDRDVAISTFAVTVEQAGGVTRTTHAPVAVSQIPA